MVTVRDALECIGPKIPVVIQLVGGEVLVGGEIADGKDLWEMKCSDKEEAYSALKNSIVVEGEFVLGLEAIVRPSHKTSGVIVIQVNIPSSDEKD